MVEANNFVYDWHYFSQKFSWSNLVRSVSDRQKIETSTDVETIQLGCVYVIPVMRGQDTCTMRVLAQPMFS